MNPQSSSQRPISNKIKCTQQKLLNERQALPKLRIHRVSIKHQLQLMIFSGGWGGEGTNDIKQFRGWAETCLKKLSRREKNCLTH